MRSVPSSFAPCVQGRRVHFVGIGGPRMESAGCELWYPLDGLALRGIVEVLPGCLNWCAFAAIYIGVCACSARRCSSASTPRFQPRLERRLKRKGMRTMRHISPRCGLGAVGASTPSPARPTACSRCSRSSGPGCECELAVTFVGHPLAAGAANASSRRMRELLKLNQVARFSRCCPEAVWGLGMHSELAPGPPEELFERCPSAIRGPA